MDEQRKRGIPRRRFLSGVAAGATAAGLAAAIGARVVEGTAADTRREDDKSKSLYRVTDEVKTYYRVNSYPR
jgi:nitrous oxide reductase